MEGIGAYWFLMAVVTGTITVGVKTIHVYYLTVLDVRSLSRSVGLHSFWRL